MNKNEIIVVSGLPRSGTSLVMQILQTLGITLFIDNHRAADESNLKGYFEHELVKTIESNSSWIADLKGKAVKIVSPLLIYLPANYNYKILFIHRDFDEIINSQERMLWQSSTIKSEIHAADLKAIFHKDIKQAQKWILENPNCDYLDLSHANLIKNPESEIIRIMDYLQIEAELKNVIQVVDINLYRARIK